MSIWVVEGSEKEKAEQAAAAESMLLMLGLAQKTIFLNGGSQTRRDAREYWRETARLLNVECRESGCMVIIGGRLS